MVAVKMPPWGSRSVFTTMTSRSDSTHFHNRDEFFFFLPVPNNKDLLKEKSMCVGLACTAGRCKGQRATENQLLFQK